MSSICQIEKINAGGAYPKSCPTCGISGKCAKGLPHPFKKTDPMSSNTTPAPAVQATDEQVRAMLAVQWPALYRDSLYMDGDGDGLRRQTQERVAIARRQYAAALSVQAETSDAEDAERYRYLRHHRPVLLLTAFFGNGCVNQRIEEVDAAIDTARAALKQQEPR